jgi:type I restriction-modification system DNA methylase subunit
MKKGYPIQTGKKTWEQLDKIRSRGYSYFFNDWIDLILNSLLQLSESMNSINTINSMTQENMQGKYNDRYMDIVHKYMDNGAVRKIGERTMDYFQKAFFELIKETEESKKDVLGEIFQAQITYGENGQFFTPEHVTECMAQIVIGEEKKETLMDPCCGSGRFILSAAKINPEGYFIGQDIDERCCKMTVINMFLRGINGEVRFGDSLVNKCKKRWFILNGFIFEDDQPKYFEKELYIHIDTKKETPSIKQENQQTLF